MSDRLPLEGCVPSFGRHRTYPPRAGWLLKVHHAVQEDPQLFARADAPVTLGVGSSMVPALRFWSRAFGLSTDAPIGGPRSGLQPTRRGHWLLGEDGADPYLEDPGSLWLLHWWLLQPTCQVPTWYQLFARAGLSRMTRDAVRAGVQRDAVDSGWSAPSDSALTRDVTAFVSMYGPTPVPRGHDHAPVEEELSNPFRALNVLRVEEARGRHRPGTQELVIDRSAGRTVPAAVIAYACLAFADRAAPGARSIALGRLRTDPGSPGRVLLLDGRTLQRALSRIAESDPGLGLAVVDSGDEPTVTFRARPDVLADQVLAAHYELGRGPGHR
ncbi:DUF4007 family protein [Streptomyces aureoversilis]|uniref:DUF4007 family protein n=1 Tax=Streptomyces aureoversilis TaxID=67277 RepID=A0ABW0A5E5_9ACTN